MSSSPKITIALAGSTKHAKNCAAVLANHPNFEISWVLTPNPKKIGRRQVLTPNPLHQWAEEQQITSFLVEDKITNQLQDQVTNIPDYLLVVDFGYFLPDWLLALPHRAPLNLHPSALPKWRGSSPGQYVILHGEGTSAVSLIKLTNKLDAGPIIQQAEFEVNELWTAEEYYQYSFNLANRFLPDWILAFDRQEIKAEPQPAKSPTPEAERINKQDAFVDWQVLEVLMAGDFDQAEKFESDLTADTLINQRLKTEVVSNWPDLLSRAARAFTPWPILWTSIPTAKGEKRMQILSCAEDSLRKLELKEVKVEGQAAAGWNQVKNQVKKK